ncbi:MAG TPA: divergent polysaccharide deacetylase family protein [Gammaproteobacteria bacterium]
MKILRALCFLLAFGAPAVAGGEPPPRIAIIIDDIGDRYDEGRLAATLPGPVACAFLPHTPYAAELARLAHEKGKEVLLHLPLQSLNGKALGPGAITLQTTEKAFRRILRTDLAAIPYVRGVNNHMGSLLTRHPGHMTWLMRVLADEGDLFFIDSYTHPGSVAFAMAREQGVRAARRDVFLDNVPERGAIAAEFRRLVAEAHERGSAIGIGHPYPETLAFLADMLPRLGEEYGVELVPVEALLSVPPHWTAAKESQDSSVTHK